MYRIAGSPLGFGFGLPIDLDRISALLLHSRTRIGGIDSREKAGPGRPAQEAGLPEAELRRGGRLVEYLTKTGGGVNTQAMTEQVPPHEA